MTAIDNTPGVIPTDTVSCPRCAGQIAMLETLTDTVDTQVRQWVCLDCCATGWIGLTIHTTTHRDELPPPRIIERRQLDNSHVRRLA